VPETDRLDRAVADRIAAYRPERVPPFAAVEDARRRRHRARVGAGAAAAAALSVAGVLTVPALVRAPTPTPVAGGPTATAPATAATTSPPVASPPKAGRSAAQDARLRWKARGARSYTIRVTLQCFCPRTAPRLVVVRHGGTLGEGPSVDDLFAMIFSGGYDRVTATYDPRYGFPTRVEVDPDLHTIDEEKTWVVTDYRPGT
jgi:hypothetical protein